MEKYYFVERNTSKLFLFFCSLFIGYSYIAQTNNIIFSEDFENPTATIANWGPATNYTITNGYAGNGLHVMCTSSTSAVFLIKNIPIDSIKGRTIALSAKVRGQNVVSTQPFFGMKVMLKITDSNKPTKYSQLNPQVGTFSWKDLGTYIVVDSTITQAELTIGIQQAVGEFWFDDIKIEIVDKKVKMPPARNPNISINKCHNLGMSRGMNVNQNLQKLSLDELATDWQADHIRWQMTSPSSLLVPSYTTDLSNSLNSLDSTVKWCKANKLKIIVDIHSLSNGLFSSKSAQTLFINTWKQIASKYKNDSCIWAYDLVNEPYYYNYGWPNNGYLLYNNLMDTVVSEIRKIDSLRPIIIECLATDISFDNFRPIDFNIPNIIYSFHFYEPFQFTHQTLYGNVIKYSFPGIINGKYYDKSVLKTLMQPIKNFQDKYRVPIYVGEFSAIRWAKNCTAYNYIRDCIEIFEEYKWDWSYHAFREYDGWSVEHSCDSLETSPAAEPTSREDLMRRYFAKKEVGITSNYFDNANYSVYPNPTENKLTIEIKNQKTETLHLKLINSNGQTLIEETTSGSFLQKEYNLETYPKGIYFLQIRSNNNISGKKIILQ